MKRTLFTILSVLIAVSSTGLSTAHATSLTTLVTCHFEKEGQKGEGDRECKATFAVLPTRDVHAQDRLMTPGNQFIVTCDDDTIYDGGAFFQAFNLSPGIGASVVAANTGIVATYPEINVDDNITASYGFDDVNARLYFSKDESISGKCDHSPIVR